MNPYRDVGNPLTLASTKNATSGDSGKALERVVQEAVRLQSESGYPQVAHSNEKRNVLFDLEVLSLAFLVHIGNYCFRCIWLWKDSRFHGLVATTF